MDRVLVYIYFIGIAAMINTSPQNNVTKQVIFPAAPAGVTYSKVPLMPHHAFLFVKGLENAKEDCARIGGSIIADGSCKAELKGAKLWVNTSDALLEDAYYRKIPSFLKSCPFAKDLPDEYTAGTVDPALVAARFEIKGGKLSACNRFGRAFVTKAEVNTNDGALYVQQNERTVRLPLIKNTVIAIENRPDEHTMEYRMEDHYGWYYAMNKRVPDEFPIVAQTKPVVGPPDCPVIAGADVGVIPQFGSAECSVQNFP